MGTGTALATVKETPGGLLAVFKENDIDIEEVAAAVSEAAGSGGLSLSDLDRIRLPGAGATRWLVETTDGEDEVPEIVGAFVGDRDVRAYWEEEFSGGNAPPDCSSKDAITGHGNPGGDCATCQFAQFGSKSNGKGQACSQRALVYLITPESALPKVISVPPSSLARVRKTFVRESGKARAKSKCLWSFTLTADKNSDNIKYSAVNVNFVRKLDPQEIELVAQYRSALMGLEPTQDVMTDSAE